MHTDARYFQIGAVISQEGKLIALYSRKPTGLQTQYTVTENELLGIVKNLREFFTILLG